jgi:protein-S-isoprenylcysteine O-methyltransferase Ste14
MLGRHLLSIALLPFTVTVLVPWWIVRQEATAFRIGEAPIPIAIQAAGLGALLIGLTLFVASLRQFIVRGRGTLAPWDPPKRLVVEGPYRYVRNPMISGVLFIVSGEAMILLSSGLAVWALIFLLINVTYIPISEEPGLRQRFGASYDEYCANVGRFIPRVTPWRM